MTIKALLWDLDGVLVATETFYWQATRHVFTDLGLALTQEEFQTAYGIHLEDPLRTLAHHLGLGDAGYLRLHSMRLAALKGLLVNEAIEKAGVASAIDSLASRYTMGVVTGSKRELFDIVASRLPFFQLFSFAVTYEDVAREKPAPDAYARAVQLTGFSPGDCLAIEDSAKGMRSALAAGVACWVIPNVLSQEDDFSAAQRVLADIDEVRMILEPSLPSGSTAG